MRIILADHHAQPCWALKTSLEEQPDFDLIGEALDAQGLLILAKQHPADLVLVDGELPGISIWDLIARLHRLEPRPIVIVMSSEIEQSRVMLKAGADAFVSKGEPDWLLEQLHRYADQVNARGGCGQK
jgi:two-component system nitrate/nitrite response regulator NarL